MKDRTVKWLIDVKSASEAILSFTQGYSFEEFAKDDRTRSAVERKFEVIGEALRRVRDEDPAGIEQIEFGSDIIGMRNRLIHGYDAVDETIVWETIAIYLPKLLEEVDSLLK
jgi:uncharacterized protein with HEPN domain